MTISARFLLVAETTRTSTVRRWLDPSTSKVRSCSTRSIFTWDAGVEVADLVEEDRPAVRHLEAALSIRPGIGERAFHVPEHLALEERGGDAAQIHLHERALRAPAVAVDGVRDQLLAGAALTGDQHRRIGRRYASDQLQDPQQARVSSDERAEVEACVEVLAGRQAVIDTSRAAGRQAERRLHGLQDLRIRPRLGDEVCRARSSFPRRPARSIPTP